MIIGTKNVEIVVSLKYLSSFSRNLEMPLINCEINLIWSWSEKCLWSNDTKAITTIRDTKNYAPLLSFSTQDNKKLLKTIKIRF